MVRLATYDERLQGLLAIGMPSALARVVAFRPELVAELGEASNIAINPGNILFEEALAQSGTPGPKRRRKKSNKYSKALSKALVDQNAKQRKKNGQYKKGKSAKTVLQAAHKQAKRMTK